MLTVTKVLHVPDWTSKDRDVRFIGLVDEAVEIIEACANGKKPDQPFFHRPAGHRAARRFVRERVGYHKSITLRDPRTHCLNFAVQGGDVIAAKAAAGHSDLSTTQVYMRSSM